MTLHSRWTRDRTGLAFHAALGLVLLRLSAGCIAYDREIQVVSEYYNESPVRIVESTYISPEADSACDEAAGDGTVLDPGTQSGCAKPQQFSQVPHLLDPEEYDFCSCRSANRKDANPLAPFQLYVEDNDPDDEVRAIILLDVDPSGQTPPNTTSFIDYVDPNSPLEVDLANPYAARLLNRRTPSVRLLSLGTDSERFDLCNGRYGASRLDPGWHTISVLVTDRTWFRAANDSVTRYGIPDLSRGATHDAVTYSFRCGDEDAPMGSPDACDCVARDTEN